MKILSQVTATTPRDHGLGTLLILVMLLSLCSSSAWGATISDFYGKYKGQADAMTSKGKQKRDLNVSIEKAKSGGFTVNWRTTILADSGTSRVNEYSIIFTSTDRENIFASQMKPNLFGGSQPMDPIKGDPFVWARLDGDTLTVFAMLITETGDYEMQIYNRTLTDTGLDLDFARYSRAKLLSRVKAKLIRVNKY